MLALTGCTAFNNSDDGTADGNGTSATTQTFQPSGGKPTATLSIASGSENKEVAVAIQKAADQSNVAVTMHYMGSLEIMNALKAGGQDHDAVWPASSMWISMGDTKHIVKDAASTSTTPIVFGIAKSKAVKLGWADDTGATKPVSTADILAAVSDGKLTFSMTSATVIDSALNVYQTALRKPSWTIWVVDYSGSMSGEGKNGVVKGLNAALDPDQAKKSYIEPASGDVNILIPFETEAHRPVKATGTSTSDLLHEADATDASGGTDIPKCGQYHGHDQAGHSAADQSETEPGEQQSDNESTDYLEHQLKPLTWRKTAARSPERPSNTLALLRVARDFSWLGSASPNMMEKIGRSRPRDL